MSDFLEIDFVDIESRKSGDAVPLRYELAGKKTIHVVDGGFQDSGIRSWTTFASIMASPRTSTG